MDTRPNRGITLSCALLLVPLAVGLTACGDDADNPLAADPYDASERVVANATDDGTVDYDKPLEVSTKGGDDTITDVSATDAAGRYVRGRLSGDGTRWRSTTPLAAGVRYTVHVRTENSDGEHGLRTLEFRTRPASGTKLAVTFGPDKGVYGVGQPVVAELSHAVKGADQRRAVERGLKVESSPRVTGSWHWVDDKKLHYRPKEYWPANARITASAALDGVVVRKGLRGGESKPLTISTGDRVETLVDIAKFRMVVKRNGETIKELPVTTGKAGFRTRNGVKVVLSKSQFIRMTGTSIGIPAGSAESYDLPVYWNTQVTRSGEFVHGAPWSVGSQGAANVSHGCTGMSTENAKWFYNLSKQGDVVKYVNGEGEDMAPFGNGYGDWNLDWDEWREGSALHQDAGPDGNTYDAARLRPQV